MTSIKVRQMDSDEIYKELVAAVIEHVLLGIGLDSLEIVDKKLKDHGITLEEIILHPEKLKSVLINIYGNSYDPILNKIKSIFGTSISQNRISNFVSVLER